MEDKEKLALYIRFSSLPETYIQACIKHYNYVQECNEYNREDSPRSAKKAASAVHQLRTEALEDIARIAQKGK